VVTFFWGPFFGAFFGWLSKCQVDVKNVIIVEIPKKKEKKNEKPQNQKPKIVVMKKRKNIYRQKKFDPP